MEGIGRGAVSGREGVGSVPHTHAHRWKEVTHTGKSISHIHISLSTLITFHQCTTCTR